MYKTFLAIIIINLLIVQCAQCRKNKKNNGTHCFCDIEQEMAVIKENVTLQPAEHGRLTNHKIGYDKFDRKRYVQAEIFPKDLKTGKSANSAAKKWVKDVGVAGDQAGHIIAEEYGGSGHQENIFPQNKEINTGAWNQVEGSVRTHVNINKNACGNSFIIPWVKVEIGFYYKENRYRNRPSAFIYRFQFMCGGTKINELKDSIRNPKKLEKHMPTQQAKGGTKPPFDIFDWPINNIEKMKRRRKRPRQDFD